MKRITAIILSAVILLSSFAPVNAAEKSTTENNKIKWMFENNLVVGRGQEKDLKLEDTITRAEFTRMVLVAKGEENLAKEDSSSKADFKDVPNTHWAEKFIAYAKQKGYISGYPDGNFRPEGEITYEEIISILARIHPNYRKIETSSTNWAEGFINFAKDNGILDDINIKGSYKSSAIREKTFEMTYNFIKFVENQTKSEKVSKIKEEKDVKKENSTWNGFYPYWLGYGFRPSEEKKPDVKPNPDVKPAPDKPEKPEKENPGAETPSEPGTEPEAPKEFDKTNITKIEIVNQPSKLEYIDGEKLDLSGIKLKLIDTQGKDKGISLGDFNEYGITTEPANGTALTVDNNNEKTVKITKGEMEVETDPLTVNPKVFDPENVKSITVKTQPTKLIYTDGEKLNLTGLVVRLTDNQNLEKEVGLSEFTAYGITTEPANGTDLALTNNENPVTITKGNLATTTNALKVNPKVFDPNHVESITVKTQPKLVYIEGEQLDLNKLVVTLTDNQGLTNDIAFAEFGSNGITTEPANGAPLTTNENDTTIKIKLNGEVKAEIDHLTVNLKVFDPNHVESITVKTQPTKLIYTDGEKLNLTGLVVTLTDNQGLTKDIAFADFVSNGITTDPENGAELKTTDNGKNVKITKGIMEVETNPLTVNKKVFDKNNITEIKVKTQPKLEYTEGDQLDLTKLVVTLKDNQELTKDVAFAEFESNGIKTDLANGIDLIVATHNGKSVTITKGNLTITTETLTIKEFNKEDITKIEVIESPKKLIYIDGEELNLEGLKIRLIDSKGTIKEIDAKEFKSYDIHVSHKDGQKLKLTNDWNTLEIKRTGAKVFSGETKLTMRVVSIDVFKDLKKESIKNSLIEVYKILGDLKFGIDNTKNKYYFLFTKDLNTIAFNKDSLKKILIDTFKSNKIKSYTIGETTRDLMKTDDEILGFIREDILKIAGLEGSQNASDKEILEKLKKTKPTTKIKLVAGDENISFDYEIIFLTQMAEEKLVDIENRFIKVMEETAKIVPQKKLEVSYLDKHCTTKFSDSLLKSTLINSVISGYKDALTSFLTGEERGKTLTLSNLKSIFISTNKINEPIVKYGMMERYELENLLFKSTSFLRQTAQFHNTFETNGEAMEVYGKPLDLFKHNTAVEYFYVDESNETGGIITRTIHFESIKK